MDPRSRPTRRDFLHLGAAAGTSLLLDAALPELASAAAGVMPPAAAPAHTWAIRGKLLEVPEPDHLESVPDALVIIAPGGEIEEVGPGEDKRAAGFRRAGRLLELKPS